MKRRAVKPLVVDLRRNPLAQIIRSVSEEECFKRREDIGRCDLQPPIGVVSRRLLDSRHSAVAEHTQKPRRARISVDSVVDDSAPGSIAPGA